MSPELLQTLFDVNHRVLHRNVNGLTHEESLIQPPQGGNCLNWIAGHIVATRGGLLELLGEKPVWSSEEEVLYRRGSKPIQDGSRAKSLATILADYDRSQERVRAGIARLTEAAMKEKRGDDTLGGTLHILHFHEAYHIGQTAILRRMAGKEGAIP